MESHLFEEVIKLLLRDASLKLRFLYIYYMKHHLNIIILNFTRTNGSNNIEKLFISMNLHIFLKNLFIINFSKIKRKKYG